MLNPIVPLYTIIYVLLLFCVVIFSPKEFPLWLIAIAIFSGFVISLSELMRIRIVLEIRRKEILKEANLE